MPAVATALGTPFGSPLALDYPLTIGALTEWFDYRTLASVGNGNPVSSWAGRKSLYTAAQTGTARPTYASNDGDGKAAVQFDGVNDFLFFSMTNGALLGPDGSFEIWCEVKSPASSDATNTIFQASGLSIATSIQAQQSSNRINVGTCGQNNYGNTLNVQDGNWHLVRFVKNGATKQLFIDGSNVGFAYSDPGPGTWDTGANLGGIGGDLSYWIGSIRHELFFNAPLDSITAANLTTYIQAA